MSFRNISAWCIRNPVPPIVLFVLLLLAGAQALITTAVFPVEFGQGLLALLAHLGQLVAAALQFMLTLGQAILLGNDVVLDIGQLAQGLIEGFQLAQAGLPQVFILGQGA